MDKKHIEQYLKKLQRRASLLMVGRSSLGFMSLLLLSLLFISIGLSIKFPYWYVIVPVAVFIVFAVVKKTVDFALEWEYFHDREKLARLVEGKLPSLRG